jgi:putative ABC transport system substrate-binding protein
VTSRRALLMFTGALGLLGTAPRARAQSAATLRRVGILHVGSEAGAAAMRAQFKQGMHELGWSEGQNIEYRVVGADGDLRRLDVLAGELAAQQLDVIVAPASLVVRAVRRATATIPIVMTGVGNPERHGFVASLARPATNVTGIANQGDELLGKQIQLLHEIAPTAQRMAILLNESNPVATALYRAAGQRACAALGLGAIWAVASVPAELPGAVAQVVSQRAQALAVVADPMFFAHRKKLHELTQAAKLPAAYGQPEHVVDGGLLSYASNYLANFRYAAKFVDKILKGADPAQLPVEQSTRFELVINLKTARALGLTIPQSLLLRADEVIE